MAPANGSDAMGVLAHEPDAAPVRFQQPEAPAPEAA
jgi:hypothetical protein